MSELSFTVWTDFLCPWCYVGAHRLATLQHEYGDALRIEWRSFLLQPEPRPKPLDRFRAYTERWLRDGGPGAAEPALDFRVWNDERPPTHSVPPALAGKAAATFGSEAFDRFHHALMRAYFTEHRDVSERSIMVAVAGEVGIDPTEFEQCLTARGAEFHETVFAEHADANDRGIYAVPTVLVNEVFPITGAQELASYRRVIEKLLAR